MAGRKIISFLPTAAVIATGGFATRLGETHKENRDRNDHNGDDDELLPVHDANGLLESEQATYLEDHQRSNIGETTHESKLPYRPFPRTSFTSDDGRGG